MPRNAARAEQILPPPSDSEIPQEEPLELRKRKRAPRGVVLNPEILADIEAEEHKKIDALREKMKRDRESEKKRRDDAEFQKVQETVQQQFADAISAKEKNAQAEKAFKQQVERASSVLGRDRAAEIWERAKTFLSHAGHEPVTEKIRQEASEYVFNISNTYDQFLQEKDGDALNKEIARLNAWHNMPQNFDPITMGGKSRPTAIRSLEMGAGRGALGGAAEQIAGIPHPERNVRVAKRQPKDYEIAAHYPRVVSRHEAPEPESTPTNEIEALRREEAKLQERMKNMRRDLPLGIRLKDWWNAFRGAPESPTQQKFDELEREREELHARRFKLEEDLHMGTYVKSFGQTVKDMLRAAPLPGIEATSERETREVEERHGMELGPEEFTDVRAFERSLGEEVRRPISELLQDPEFRRAQEVLGTSNQREALAFFQHQRKKEFDDHAADPEIVDPNSAWEFLRALADYMEARRKREKQDVMDRRTALTKLGERYGIPSHETLGLISRLMQHDAAQKKMEQPTAEAA